MSTRIVPSYETYEFDVKKNLYCICVFVINEGEKLLNQLKTMSGICTGLVDVVVADGGSTDGSTDHDTLKALGVNTLLVKTGEGKLGSQMRMAFDWALNRGYEGVVVVDGNGKDGMDAIPRFVEELKNGVDHVQGSRFIKGGHHENTPKSRLWGLKLLHVPLMRLASGFKYTDTTNGFRAYSARLLSSDKLNIFRNCFAGYELHYYLAIEAARQKYKCSEIPVSRVYPASGKVPTKISGIKGNAVVILKLFLSCLHFYTTKSSLLRYVKSYFMLLFSIAFAFFAYLSYYNNEYSVVEEKRFEQWEQGSEGIVVREKINPETRHEKKWYSLYPMMGHYIGGQGIVDSYICHLFEDASLDRKIDILKKIVVLLTVVILAYLCFWIGTEFSLIASVFFAFCAVFCQFLVISARNLYWSTWTMYLPLALFLFTLRREERGYNKKNGVITSYLIAVASMMFMRFAVMFEYSSSMMILTELPLLYYALKNRWSSKKFFLNAFWTGIVSVVVFILSFLVLFVQILAYRANWDLSKGWYLITDNVRNRVGIGAENQPDVYVYSFLPDLDSLFQKYLSCSAFVNGDNEYKVSAILILAFVLFFIGVLAVLLSKQKNYMRKYIAFGSFVFLSTLLQFIWIITAKGHSSIHTFINFILWNIPMLLISAFIGYTITVLFILVRKNLFVLKKNIYTWILTCTVVFGLFSLCYIYQKSNYSGFEILLKRFENKGTQIDSCDVQYMIFPEQKKMYLRIPNNQAEAHKFFYHIYPLLEDDVRADRKQYKFNNLDFSIKNKKDKAFVQKQPFSNSQYEIVQCQLPSYHYSKIIIGQYDSSQYYWTLELKNEIPETRQYKICNISDANWTTGVRKGNKKCILFMSSQFILPGDYVTFPDKSIGRVNKVEVHGQYLHVFIDKDAPSFDPNQPCTFSKKKPEALLRKEAEQLIAAELAKRKTESKDSKNEELNPSAVPMAVPVVTPMEGESKNLEVQNYYLEIEKRKNDDSYLEGRIIMLSQSPDPNMIDYPDCDLTAKVLLNDLSKKEICLVIPCIRDFKRFCQMK